VFQTAEFQAFKEEMQTTLASSSACPTTAVDYRMLSQQIAQHHASVESARQQDAHQRQALHQEQQNFINMCMSTLCIRVGESFQAVGQQQLQQAGGTASMPFQSSPSSVSAGNPSSSPVFAGNPAFVSTGNPSSTPGTGGDAIATYRPPAKLHSVTSFFREWHGEAGTITEHLGGFKKLEKTTAWHRSWKESEKKRWNRMKKVVEIVEKAFAQNADKPKLHVLHFYDEKWKELNGALTTFATAAEKSGWQIPEAPTVDVHDTPAHSGETVEV
jgi:hypothetical protein